MEAAGLPAKKLRSEPSKTAQPKPGAISPAAATDASDPKTPDAGGDGSCGQAPPPRSGGAGAGEEGGVDRISGLPEAILGDIVSLLPTKDGARTLTLASQPWRHLWRSAPLNLDCAELPYDDAALPGVVSHILAGHRGSGRRFRVPSRLLHDYPSTMDAWLQSPALENLQELDLYEDINDSPILWHLPPAPSSTFRFSSCLRVATLSKCDISDGIAQALQFPQLKKLGLQYVRISEGSLHSLIACCPVLECLLFRYCFGFRCVRITSASLISIGVSAQDCTREASLQELIIVDAPCLERFVSIRVHENLRVSVISAPKLETLGCLYERDSSFNIVLGSTEIQGLHVISSTAAVSTVKTLAVDIYNLNLDIIVDLIRCFPCLEKLYVQSQWSGGSNLWRRKYRKLIGSLDIRLKTIVMRKYRGTKSQINFATFFILNAKMLETMTFDFGSYVNNFAQQSRLLQLDKRASIGAQFYYTIDKCDHYLSHIKHVHDLSVKDPFDCTC